MVEISYSIQINNFEIFDYCQKIFIIFQPYGDFCYRWYDDMCLCSYDVPIGIF